MVQLSKCSKAKQFETMLGRTESHVKAGWTTTGLDKFGPDLSGQEKKSQNKSKLVSKSQTQLMMTSQDLTRERLVLLP